MIILTKSLSPLSLALSLPCPPSLPLSLPDESLQYVSILSVPDVLSYPGLVEPGVLQKEVGYLRLVGWRGEDLLLHEEGYAMLWLLVKLLSGCQNELEGTQYLHHSSS